MLAEEKFHSVPHLLHSLVEQLIRSELLELEETLLSLLVHTQVAALERMGPVKWLYKI